MKKKQHKLIAEELPDDNCRLTLMDVTKNYKLWVQIIKNGQAFEPDVLQSWVYFDEKGELIHPSIEIVPIKQLEACK